MGGMPPGSVPGVTPGIMGPVSMPGAVPAVVTTGPQGQQLGVPGTMAPGGMHPPLTPGGGPRGPRGRGIRGARTPGARTPGARMRGPRPGAGMGPTGPRMPGPQGMPGPHSDPSMQGKQPLLRLSSRCLELGIPFKLLMASPTKKKKPQCRNLRFFGSALPPSGLFIIIVELILDSVALRQESEQHGSHLKFIKQFSCQIRGVINTAL